ncbi:MAG: hypothetical protein ACRCXD_00685 [Luteolibacter sp.]
MNHILLDEGLRDQTQEHCSYCDMTPICPPGTETIDHYRPKSGPAGRLDLAYDWANLFYCCNYCQGKKLDQFEDALLKPDEVGYEFETYFQWEVATGRLMPNEVASPDDRYRAERTIEIFKLNEKHPQLRQKERNSLQGGSRDELDGHSYRNFLELAFD